MNHRPQGVDDQSDFRAVKLYVDRKAVGVQDTGDAYPEEA
jgi:hypothetical protein